MVSARATLSTLSSVGRLWRPKSGKAVVLIGRRSYTEPITSPAMAPSMGGGSEGNAACGPAAAMTIGPAAGVYFPARPPRDKASHPRGGVGVGPVMRENALTVT